MPTLILLFLLLVSVPGWAATRLVVASGGATTGDCTSTACTVARAITQAVPGDTITLANGTYSGTTTINCNSGAQNGTSLNRITMQATNERQARLLGTGESPLRIYNCSFWTFEGLHVENVDNSSTASCCTGAPVYTESSHHNIYHHLLVHHNNRWNNSQGIEFYLSDDNLIEENELYDFHRHGIIIQQGFRNIIRRNYVNSRGFSDLPGCTGSTGTQTPGTPRCSNNGVTGDTGIQMYPGADTIVENNISEGQQYGFEVIARFGNGNNNRFYGNISKDNQYGLSLTAGCDNNTVQDMPGDAVIQDTVAITLQHRGFRLRSTKNAQGHHNTVIGSLDEGAWYADLDGSCPGDGAPTSFVDNLLATHTSSVSAYGINVSGQSNWSADYLNIYNYTSNSPSLADSHVTHATTVDPQIGACYAWIPDASPMKGAGSGGTDLGANILYRYQDGALSSTPLWDTTTGDFTCGVVVAGVNDNDANNCRGIPARFHINQGGCAFPSSYTGILPVERTALHITAAERTIWNQRIVAGTPYQSDWTRILGRANTFVATPTGTWTGNQLGVAWNGAAVVAGTQPPNVMPDGSNGGDRTTGDFVRDAGFVYAVTGDTSYRDAALTLLLTQAAIAGTDFANTTKWATTYTDASEDFEIAIWLRKLVYAYSYIRPSISSGDQATLDAWFNAAGTYWALVLQNVTATRFPNRLSDDYATVSFSCVKPVGGSSAVTHFGGYAIDQFGFPWNNKRMNFAAMIAAVGATTVNSTLKNDAKRMFKEWLRSNIFPDGTSWEQARWTTGNPQSGFNYAWTVVGSASTIADHLARTGDTELYEYSTSEGNCGSEGGPKSLHQILQRYANITLGNTLIYASLTSTSDPNLLIDSSGPGGTLYNDVNLAQPNVYYRDALLTSSYTRTMPSSWNAGGYDGFGGDWGHLPAARFMFGQMEGLVWPYSASPGPLGTVAKYLFSEGSGVTVADSSGLGHTGTFAPDAGWTTGLIGPYAGLFDGTRYVSIPGVSELRPTTEATIGVWFKATTTDVGGSTLVSLPNDGLMPYLTSLGRAACQLYDELGHFVSITSSGSYVDDVRHFLNCTYLKGDGLYLRVDHTQVGFTSLSTNISYTLSGTNNVELGRSSGNTTNLNFVGSLDHITLKDTACDTACDLALFQEGMTQRRIMVLGVR